MNDCAPYKRKNRQEYKKKSEDKNIVENQHDNNQLRKPSEDYQESKTNFEYNNRKIEENNFTPHQDEFYLEDLTRRYNLMQNNLSSFSHEQILDHLRNEYVRKDDMYVYIGSKIIVNILLCLILVLMFSR